MDKVNRLRSNMEFKKVYSGGKNYWNKYLIIYVRKNNLNYTRIGYSISKKVGNSVVRNKIRRRMKEIYRLKLNNIKEGYDIIIIPKRNAVNISYLELESAMLHIFKLGDIIEK
ncbi:MAG: ribonuclease P protein component [Tissierellaceae bacterium]|nr:ribonuclease P protein component [Tissierellaceae bacterium]